MNRLVRQTQKKSLSELGQDCPFGRQKNPPIVLTLIPHIQVANTRTTSYSRLKENETAQFIPKQHLRESNAVKVKLRCTRYCMTTSTHARTKGGLDISRD